MKLNYAFLAKAVELDSRGAGVFSVLYGGIDALYVDKIPSVLTPFSLMARFTAETESEIGKHTLFVELFGPGGDKLLDARAPFEIPMNTESELPLRSTLVMVMEGLEIRQEGKYFKRILEALSPPSKTHG